MSTYDSDEFVEHDVNGLGVATLIQCLSDCDAARGSRDRMVACLRQHFMARLQSRRRTTNYESTR